MAQASSLQMVERTARERQPGWLRYLGSHGEVPINKKGATRLRPCRSNRLQSKGVQAGCTLIHYAPSAFNALSTSAACCLVDALRSRHTILPSLLMRKDWRAANDPIVGTSRTGTPKALITV